MDLREILNDAELKSQGKVKALNINKVTDDSRQVSPGDLFVAVKGHSMDASEFIDSAIKRGARAIVTEKDFEPPKGVVKILVDDTRAAMSVIADNFYGHPSRWLKVVGVTGTNGKTTITYLIEGMIKAAGSDAGVIGTINYRFKERVLPARNTTPGPLELQRILAEMVKSRIGYAVMEVSSHSLDQGRVERVLFDVAIFTNLTSDHLDYHKTADNYFNAKTKLFDKLKTKGTAILNIDDKRIASLKESIKRRVISYGIKGKCDVTAKDIKLSMDGTKFIVKAPGMSFEIYTKLIGMHNVSNILASVAAALALKIPKEAIIKGIRSVERVNGRLDAIETVQPFKVFVDFAHTEDALFNVLSLLREVAKSRIITVFGCGGDRDRTKRPLMGRVACEYSDRVIITSDNPRFEEPKSIIDEIESGIKDKFSNYDIVIDRKDAIAKALSMASKGDIVIIAGKGHESCQIIKERVIPFDDREIALEILGNLKALTV